MDPFGRGAWILASVIGLIKSKFSCDVTIGDARLEAMSRGNGEQKRNVQKNHQ